MSDIPIAGAHVRITGDSSSLGSAANQAVGYLAQLEQAVATNWWGIRNLGMAFAALPAAVAGGISLAINSASQWETAMAGVEKTTFDASLSTAQNEAQLASLEKQLIDISRVKPIATVEIAGIAESAGALGIAQKDIAQFTSVVADLTATTDLSADQASTSLARIAGLTGVPAAGFDNLASAILDTGRATAATESDITAISERIAGMSATFGISAPNIVGFAAAMRSAGINSELAGTQFQKTFVDISGAVSEGGAALNDFADIAGMSSAEFAKKFKANSAAAFTDFIMGLARMQKGGGDVIGALSRVGITEQRQIRLLTLLAAAQNSTTNSNLKLTNILDMSNASFKEGTSSTQIAAQMYATFANQLKILKNNLFELGVQIGNVFLPALKAMVNIIQNVVAGFRVMPGPIKLVLAVIIGLVTAIFSLLAAAFLIVPRIVLAGSALRKMAADMKEAKVASAAAAAQADADAVAYDLLAAAVLAAADAQATEIETLAALTNAEAAAGVARAQQAEAALAMVEAENAVLAAEATYTADSLKLTQARIFASDAEMASRILAAGGIADADTLVIAAEEKLATAQAAIGQSSIDLGLALNARNLAMERTIALDEAVIVLEADVSQAMGTHVLAAGELAQAELNASEMSSTLGVTLTEEAAAARLAGEASSTSAQEISLLSTAAAGASKAFGYIIIAMTAFTAISASAGDRQRKAEEAARNQEKAISKLTDAFIDGDKAGKKTIDTWIKQKVASEGLMTTAKKLGISYKELYAIIAGTATAEQYKAFTKTLEEGNKKGIAGTKEFGASTRLLNRQIANSKDEALGQGATMDSLAAMLGKATTATDDLTQAQEAEAQASRKVSAATGIVDAYFAQQAAASDVIDSQRALDKVRKEAQRGDAELAKAETGLAQARLAAKKDADSIRDAERNLANARFRQDEELIRSTSAVADAQDALIAAHEATAEAEKKVREARDPKNTEDMRKAVLDLADAEKSLRDGQQKAADAQWYLNYLREEGAGKRDITVAANEQKDAALDIAKATDQQAKAKEALNKLTDPTEKAKALAKAERELAAAKRAEQEASLSLRDSEIDLQAARQDASTNRKVRDAENELADARLRASSDQQAVIDAENQLADARANSVSDRLMKAEADYEQAVWKQAQAVAEVKKQLLELSGQEVTASDEAHLVADAMQSIVDKMPDGAAKKKMQDFIDILKGAPDVNPSVGVDPSTAPTPPPSGFGQIDPLHKFKEDVKGKSMWSNILETIKRNLAGIGAFLGYVFGPAIITAITGAEAASWMGPVGALVGALVGFLIGLLIKFGPAIGRALMGFIKRIPHYLGNLVTAFGKLLQKLPGALGFALGFLVGIVARAIVFLIKAVAFLAVGLVKAFVALFKLLWRGVKTIFSKDFYKTIWEGINKAWDVITSKKTWTDLWNKFTKALGDVGHVLKKVGGDLVKGLWDGFTKAFPEGGKWLKDRWDGIIKTFKRWMGISSPSKKMYEIGKWIIQGLWNGVKHVFNGAKGVVGWMGALPGRILRAIGNLRKLLLEKGKALLSGLWDGIKEKWDSIKTWFQDRKDAVVNTLKKAFGLEKKGAGILFQVGKDLFDGLKKGIGDKWNSILAWASTMKDVLLAFLGDPLKWLEDMGKNVFQGFINGMKSLWKKIPEPLRNAAEAVVGGLTDFFDMHSPSRKMHHLGLMVGMGLKNGLSLSMKDALQTFDKSMQSFDINQLDAQFKQFGIDSFDIAAYVGNKAAAPLTTGVKVPAAAPTTTTDAQPTVVEEHLHLTAMTKASPKEIFDEYGWSRGARIRTRGRSTR